MITVICPLFEASQLSNSFHFTSISLSLCLCCTCQFLRVNWWLVMTININYFLVTAMRSSQCGHVILRYVLRSGGVLRLWPATVHAPPARHGLRCPRSALQHTHPDHCSTAGRGGAFCSNKNSRLCCHSPWWYWFLMQNPTEYNLR